MQLRALSVAVLPSLLLGLASCGTSSEPSSEAQAASLAEQRAPYRFELAARGSEDPYLPGGAYRLPAGVFIKNMSPSLNDQGDVALDFLAFDGHQHIWKNGQIVHDVPDTKAVVSGTSLGSNGDVAFDVMGGTLGNGVFVYSAANGQTSFLTSEPLGAESWINVRLLDDARIGCRAGGSGQRFVGIADADGFRRIALEAGTLPSSPYEYLFSPQFDRRGNAAVKAMLTTGGEEIRFFKTGASPVTIAQTHEANPASPYTAIDNGLGLSEDGQIAFVAKTDGKRAVFRVTAGVTTRIAAEGADDIREIAYFTPVLNASGLVAFKGEDTQRRNTIWIGDGTKLRRLITAGDALPSDKGATLALPETEFDPNNRVVFGGGLAMNARGAVLFSAALAQQTAKGTERLGTGIYLAIPE
jgi:hypothetical protein